MIYSLQVLVTFILVIVSVSDAFRMVSPAQKSSSMKMALADYREELAKTAAAIAAPGLLVLLMDTKSICSHFFFSC